jgi:large-conductance mechanosensitive channel
VDVVTTITRPWREPIDYMTLVAAVVIFCIIAFAVFDSMRVLAAFVREAV